MRYVHCHRCDRVRQRDRLGLCDECYVHVYMRVRFVTCTGCGQAYPEPHTPIGQGLCLDCLILAADRLTAAIKAAPADGVDRVFQLGMTALGAGDLAIADIIATPREES